MSTKGNSEVGYLLSSEWIRIKGIFNVNIPRDGKKLS